MSMTFEEWWDKFGHASPKQWESLRGMGRACWNAAQAQCAAGEWQSIEAYDPSMGYVMAREGKELRVAQLVEFGHGDWEWEWSDADVYPGTFDPTHFARLHEVQL